MTAKRYRLIPGLGIEDTETEDIYITPQEILWLVNHLNQQLMEKEH